MGISVAQMGLVGCVRQKIFTLFLFTGEAIQVYVT